MYGAESLDDEFRKVSSATGHRMTVAYDAGQGIGTAPQTDTAPRKRITWVWAGRGMRMFFQ